MVNEHYVQRSYLRLFSPANESVISRYSLVEKHGGGDYYDPIDRFSVENAASTENYADGLFESNETTRAEKAMVESLRKIDNGSDLSEEDIANISQFIVFQRDRSPKAKTFHRLRHEIFQAAGVPVEADWESIIEIDSQERYEGFQFMGWRVIENKTDLSFFTSDSPVVMYQDEHPDKTVFDELQFTGKEVFCPISTDKLLLLLDPNTFNIEPQFPSTEISRLELNDTQEVWKYNFLQGINAFHEIFGPVGYGEKLESMIETLCERFPDDDYIRGNRWDTDRILDAQRYGFREATDRPDQLTIPPEEREVITASKKVADAPWMYKHKISLISQLRREEPVDNYW
ncbi:DUF4238 domain-containing protein [Haloferax chudinovii]|uniref:DUF4238 domain-containing protein n=1 Tax=Haloferax chudinovii TaxID=1109010 RepID=A0ABD5XLC0_9EURY